MDKRDNFNFSNGSALIKDSDKNKSFVRKVQSRVSGLLSTSLTKWFLGEDSQTSITRSRDEDDDEDDEGYNTQPPSKRIKMPTLEDTYINSVSSSSYPKDLNIGTPNFSNHTKISFEPVAGPSGIQTNKPNLESNLFNGDKDSDSSESSETCTSRLQFIHPINEPKKILSSKTPPASLNRSLFNDRSPAPRLNTSLSSRRPSFNASTFGSPNFVDRTLSTKRILNSPFYKGRTIYGGASAYSAQNKNMVDRQLIKKQVQVTPVNKTTSNDVTLSETARRILHALEEFRSPLSDARRVPPPEKKRRPEGILSKYTGANPYIREQKIPLALSKELQVPTVPDLLKMKLKERLQDSTVAVRQIATTSKSALNKDDYKLRTEDETSKHSNKIKNKITMTRQQKPEAQVAEVNLPNITLPITTLPKFDFSLPPPPSNSKQPLITVACNELPKNKEMPQKKQENVEIVTPDSDNMQYKFSNPLVLAENLISIIAINDFKFSDPVFKQNNKEKPLSDVTINFKSATDNLKRKVTSETPQPAFKLSKDSNNEVFNKKTPEISLDKFKPAPETWECSVCLIRNIPDKLKCAACETPKPQNVQAKPKDFGDKFKMTDEKWECSTCMVRNLNKDSNCVACTNPNPTKDNKTNGPILACNTSFGDTFKVPVSIWTCPTCMIQNKNELEKCAACEEQKPGTKSTKVNNDFGEAFKKKTNEWECKVCMIRNFNDKDKCVACETPKSGSHTKLKKQEDLPIFTFGIFPSTKNTTITSEVKTSTVSAPITAMTPLTTVTQSITSTSVPTFSFGIPQKQTAPSSSATEASKVESQSTNKPDSSIPITSNKQETKQTHEVEIKEPVKQIPPELSKPIISTGGFAFGNFSKPKDEVKITSSPKTSDNTLSKPIITSPPQSAFTFNSSTPASTFNSTTSAPTLKRTLNDADSTTEMKKVLSSSIIFSPPKADANSIKSSLFAQNLGNQEKNLFGSVTKPQTSIAMTTQTHLPGNSTFSFTNPQTQAQVTSAAPVNLFAFNAKTTAPSVFGNTTTTQSIPMFKFNQPEPKNTLPNFGITSEPQSQMPLFGKPSNSIFGTVAKSTPTPSPAFGVTSSGFGTDIKPSNPPGFGTDTKQPSTSGFGGDIKQPSGFGAEIKQSATPSAFGAEIKQSATPSGFGTEIKQSATPSGFGTEIKQSAPPGFGTEIKQPMFGTDVKQPSPFVSEMKPPPFGSTDLKPFTFGARPNEETTKPLFSFGSAAVKAPEPAKPAFNFSSAINQSTAPAGGFNFGGNNNTNPTQNFNFTAPKVEAASPFQSPPATNIFNTPLQSQSQPLQNGGFNFGSPPNTNNSMKTGFNFGTTHQFNATAAPSAAAPPGVFSFGSNPNAAPPPVGGFNFGQNATPSSAFNANLKPNFNFTAGNLPTTFSATSENSSTVQRRRLKAVRRNQR